MKVYYKVKTDFRAFDALDERIEFCCEEMTNAWDEAIKWSSGDFDKNNRYKRVVVSKCSPYPEGAVFDDYEIKFCPFCGQKIEVIEVTN